ncbi:hypothetical protein TRFO_28953 [Tritrichomonas foetus]|uniref:Elongator complex protein 1 n=1 Tax=Tritrichomonas foetus TaxID=1144522 RepID=A0A1J4K1L1_9EUKA|nr:hypothetical protein TRFO_28953 [Tritrichomonas foetus]|eukprot:OHT03628.1 hypothetical protein TRFO_28953 [Tritrichomonas foetus]
MQNLHLINTSSYPIKDFIHPSQNLPLITALYNEHIKLLFPELGSDPISVCFSDFLNHYVIFMVDEVLIEGESEPFFTLPFLINYATLSKSGDFAILASNSDIYILDMDSDSTNRLNKIVEDFDQKILFAAFRNDNKFCAICTETMVRTISHEIPEQQGQYEVSNPSGVAWNPLGSWLAVSSGKKVIFLEKNCCLRQVVEVDDEIISISWSSHRDIISVMDKNYKITILSMKNRVFFSKYVIQSSCELHPAFFWSKIDLSFAVINPSNQTVLVYDFNHSVDKDEKSIYVFNGNILNVSDWSRSLIPPPLAHRKITFDSQITAFASNIPNSEEIAVFTLTSLNFPHNGAQFPLDAPVQCATYIANKLFFASSNKIFTFSDGSIQLVNELNAFCSFITPSYTVTSMSTIISSNLANLESITEVGQSKTIEPISEFIQNEGETVAFCRNGKLLKNESLVAENVISVLFEEKLFAYIYLGAEGTTCHIQYGLEQAKDRQIEPLAQLLYFSRPIYSLITLMNRGNIETNTPHVIVEAALRSLIADDQYEEAHRLSKKYQIPFSRFIQLGDIDLGILCQQIPDTQLRSCLSVLTPLKTEKDMSFVLAFLSHILGAPVTYDKSKKQVIVPQYDVNREKVSSFATSCCICFVLLDSPVSAVSFSCAFPESDNVKNSITFLLTLYDNNQLYDISLKTYNTNCIASVALITMKEPSSYVPFIEELDNCTNNFLKMAKIDEAASDQESAIRHYAQAGEEYEEKVIYIIGNESRLKNMDKDEDKYKLYDVGLESYPKGTPVWLKIIRMKIEALTSVAKRDRDNDAIAKTVIRSENSELIVEFIKEIVKSKCWFLSVPFLSVNEYPILKKALEDDRQFIEAANFTAQYLPNEKEEITRLFLLCHEWYRAVQNGAPLESTAITAYETLMKETHRKRDNARMLKHKFDEVAEKQKIHPDSSIRHGKNKDKRGLPAIVSQLTSLLPDDKKDTEYRQVADLLKFIGELDKCEELRVAYREMARSIWPIPKLPENEEMPIPIYLRGIV